VLSNTRYFVYPAAGADLIATLAVMFCKGMNGP